MLKRLLVAFCLCVGAGLSFTAMAQQQAPDDPSHFYEVFGPCQDPCVIKGSFGGDLLSFTAAADEVLAGAKKQVVIAGPCYSACAYFADLARSKVCITGNAVFGFHMWKDLSRTKFKEISSESFPSKEIVEYTYIYPKQSRDITDWVEAHGGYPKESMLMMGPKDAQHFWPLCPNE